MPRAARPDAGARALTPPLFTREPVHVLAWRYLDRDGGAPTFGGAQRWLRALCRLLNDDGHPVVVHQRAARRFAVELAPGVTVLGHKAPARAFGSPAFNVLAHRKVPAGAPVVYMVEDLVWPLCRERSVVVQHGVWWDGEYGRLRVLLGERLARRAVRRSRAVLCVDTNFPNWYRARWPRAGDDRKLRVVPNFVDPGELGPQPAAPAAAAAEPITILFPRRSEPRRGIDLMAAVAPRLAARFPGTRFRFAVGSGHHTERLRARLGASDLSAERWSIESLPFESMPEAYASAAIAVVPTVCGEGTSLAALEAMWFGCALVATWVGGLPNLVCDDRDGLLIPPLEAELEEALARLCADRALRVRLGCEAQATARHFAIARWRERVRSVLSVLGGGVRR